MDDLVDATIQVCRPLIVALGVCVPQHLYSHVEGTLLDDVLDMADAVAKIGAANACPRVGYLVGLQFPQAVVTRQAFHTYGSWLA